MERGGEQREKEGEGGGRKGKEERNGRNKKEKFQESSRTVIRSSQLKMQPTFGPTGGTTRFEYPTELRQAHGPLSQAKRSGNFSGITQDVK